MVPEVFTILNRTSFYQEITFYMTVDSMIIIVNILQVLLVTSSRRPELWIVPGGGVEPEEEPPVTAVREVLEEAGVVGSLGRCLGVFEVKSI